MTLTTALISCTILGFQHGIDWDHVAAISDVASVQATSREATYCGLFYAAGHATTVGILGLMAIMLRHSLPGTIAVWMQRITGLTLILLGVYVLTALFSGQSLSRGQAIIALLRRLTRSERRPVREIDPGYGRKSSLSLGVLHGVGAETPTQLSMLAIAANLGEVQSGVLGLAVFTAAMFASNIALTTAATSVFAISRPRPMVFRWFGAFTAGYSLWIGFVMTLSRGVV